MSDILERLQNMFFRFGTESPDDAANRRIQTAKDAADEIEKLRAALKTARRDAREEAARWHDEQAQIWKNTYVKETLSDLDMQAARITCLERYSFHKISAVAIRALGEKE
jgi:hypothetical protein